VDHRKSDSSIGFETWKWFWNLARFTIFKVAILLIRHDLIVLTKAKEMTRYCGSYAFGVKSALDNCFYHFNTS
jgi:hypothetical protein